MHRSLNDLCGQCGPELQVSLELITFLNQRVLKIICDLIWKRCCADFTSGFLVHTDIECSWFWWQYFCLWCKVHRRCLIFFSLSNISLWEGKISKKKNSNKKWVRLVRIRLKKIHGQYLKDSVWIWLNSRFKVNQMRNWSNI